MITRRLLTGLALATPSLLRSGPASARPLRVAFVNPGRADEAFWIMAEAVMSAAARNLNIELEVLSANRSRQRMRDLALEVVGRADLPNALVITNEEQSARDVLLAADRRGLRTLLIATDLTGAQAEEIGAPRERLRRYVGSVTPDHVAAGHHLADAVLAAAGRLPGAGGTPKRLFAIAADQMTPASVDRVEGLEAALRSHPAAVLDRIVYANWSGTEAQTLAARHIEWARRNGRLPSAVWGASDAMALGAAVAFAEAGLEPGRNVVFGGVNWSKQGIEAVSAGRMAVTVGGHFFCGAWGLVLLRDLFDGHDFAGLGSSRVRIPLSALTADSAPRYMAALGNGEWGRVDYARFLRGARSANPYDFSLEAVLAATSV